MKNNQLKNDYVNLTKACIYDLKKIKFIKSIKINEFYLGRKTATIEDYYSNTIDIKIGLKSSEYIQDNNGFSQSLEDSAYIILLDKYRNELRITTSEYASNGELSDLFNLTKSQKEDNDLLAIKEILIKKGLKFFSHGSCPHEP